MIFQHIDNYKTFENDIKKLSNEDDFETSCENIEEFLTQYYKKDLLYFFSQLCIAKNIPVLPQTTNKKSLIFSISFHFSL
tara:strand:+ start:410 stop:649 length:240 start_codon:yes stop_codon:yes gene_type:complete